MHTMGRSVCNYLHRIKERGKCISTASYLFFAKCTRTRWQGLAQMLTNEIGEHFCVFLRSEYAAGRNFVAAALPFVE